MKQKPEVKQGNRGSRRVYWVQCPKCGAGREHVSKVAANNELKSHKCDE